VGVSVFDDGILVVTLQLAVPLWIAEAHTRTGETRVDLLRAWREDASEVVAHRGDALMFTTKKRGDTAKAFNSLARGIAALACHRGGVTVFGYTWCAEHAPGGNPVDDLSPICGRCYMDDPATPKDCSCCSAYLDGTVSERAQSMRKRYARDMTDVPLPLEDVSQ
jgi:hypothetical protein